MNNFTLEPRATDPATPWKTTDCWKQIGVWGDGSCRELKQATHCRNCRVYSAVGLQLLDRELPAEYLDEATALLAQPQAPKVKGLRSAILFRIGAEWFALPIEVLVEVIERRVVHSVPHAASHVLKGLVNVRGELQICISLTKLMGLANRSEQQKSRHSVFERLLVIKRDGHHLVIPATEVFGLARYHPEHLREAPATARRSKNNFLRAVIPWTNPKADDENRKEISVGLLDNELIFNSVNTSLA